MSREDFRILESLDDPDILVIQSPSIISYNLDISRSHVSRRLGEFVDRGLVEKVENGRYRISTQGRDYLAGDLDADDLENHNI